jgi:hypothetical protein
VVREFELEPLSIKSKGKVSLKRNSRSGVQLNGKVLASHADGPVSIPALQKTEQNETKTNNKKLASEP